MRTIKSVAALFPRTRSQILSALVMHPTRAWFLSELARHLKVPKTSLPRELANLERAGIILREVQGRQVYFKANPACPYLPELQGLLAKTSGLVDVVRETLEGLTNRISFAFIYGSVASGTHVTESDVDVMVVGKVGLVDLVKPTIRARERLARDVNPTVFSLEEFVERSATDGFVRAVLAKPKLFVVGTADELEAAIGRASRRPSAPGSRRDRGATGARRPRVGRRTG